MTDPSYTAAWCERFGLASPAGALALREGTTAPPPPPRYAEPRPDADVLRLHRRYRWTPHQIGALLRLPAGRVARILAARERRP